VVGLLFLLFANLGNRSEIQSFGTSIYYRNLPANAHYAILSYTRKNITTCLLYATIPVIPSPPHGELSIFCQLGESLISD
jgi:hypothetical protein